MTITDTPRKYRYQGNGSTDTFAFSGRAFATSDLVVQLITRATDEVAETLTESTHYTVTIADNGTASVEVVPAKIPSSTQDILIYRSLPKSQSTSLPTGTVFPAKIVETALDKLTAQIQELKEEIDRKLGLPISSSGAVPTVEAFEDYSVLISENEEAINTVADNLNGADTIGIVAAIDDAIVTNAENIAEIIAVANGLGEISNGTSAIVYNAASGVDFEENEIGVFRTSGFIKANASNLATTEGFIAMATAAISGGSSGTWLVRGLRSELTGLVSSKTYYLSTTAGAITFTPPYSAGNAVRPIGTTNPDGVLYFEPSPIAPVVVEESNINPPVLIESSSSSYSAAASFTCNWPPELQSGEHVLLIASYDSDGTSNTFTPPAEFDVSVAAFTKSDGSNEGVGMQAWLMQADGTEGESFTFTQSLTRAVALVAIRISGLDPTNPISVAVVPDYAAASEPSLASVDVPVDKTMVIAAACWDAGKTLVTPPTGFTALQHVDLNGSDAGHPSNHDLWVGYLAQAIAGETGALTFDLSGTEDWVGFNIVLQQSGASVGAPSDFVAPFNVADDGFGYAMKLTLPIDKDGNLSGKALEVFCSTSADYVAGSQQLESYSHPIYFQRTNGRFRMSSPRDGATTANAATARCEFRHERNYLPTERIRFKSTFSLVSAADGADMVVCQIHRVSAAPIKAQLKVASDGNSISFRVNARNDFIDSGDRPTDKDGNPKTIDTTIQFNDVLTCEMDWDQPTGNLKIWFNKANTEAPDLWYENMDPVDANGNPVASYIKPGGVYVGTTTASGTDLITVDLIDFEIVEDTPSTAPTNLFIPTITGTPTVGQVISGSDGTWAGSSPMTPTYSYERDGVVIAGATSSTYTLVTADGGHEVTRSVIMTNAAGSSPKATSLPVTVAALSAPVNTVAPVVSGTEAVGSVLTCTPGTYTGSAPITLTYQWYVSPGTAISGATNLNYLLTASEEGYQVFCRETPSNGAGAGSAVNSNTTGVIAAAPTVTLLSSAVSSVCYEIDATVDDSYSGSGTALLNIEPTPADGAAQGDYDFTISGLTFTGSAGDPAAYLSSAGSGYITIDAMTTFLNTLHKTSGTSFWFLMAGQFVNSASTQTFFSTLGSVEDNTANNGMLVRTNTSEQPRIYQLTAGTPTKESASPVQTLLLAQPSFFAMSFNLTNGQITTWVADGAGGITEVVTSITLQANTANPDGVFRLMACTAATQLMASGTRFYASAMGNSTINATDLANLLAILGARHSRNYTP